MNRNLAAIIKGVVGKTNEKSNNKGNYSKSTLELMLKITEEYYAKLYALKTNASNSHSSRQE